MKNKVVHKHECETDFIVELMNQIGSNKETNVLKLMIENSLKEFSLRAKRYRFWYYVTKFTSFVAPLIITTITSLPVYNGKYYIVFLSLIASLAVGISGMGMFHENWIRNRYYCEQLKFEVMQYVSDTGDYDSLLLDDKIDLFGKKVHGILKSENMEWKETAEQEYNAVKLTATADNAAKPQGEKKP